MTPNPLLQGIKYRTFPTGVDYTFDFGRVDGEWRAYIRTEPDYRHHSTSAHATHRLTDSHGRYVCWDSPVTSLSQCQAVAALWADCTEVYIRTGTFTPPQGRPTVRDRSVVAHLNEDQARAAGQRITPAARPVAAIPLSPSEATPPTGSVNRFLARLRNAL